VPLPDFIRTATFRWTLAIASAFVLYTLVLFGFVYWQTAAYVMSESDVFPANELSVFAANTPEQRLAEIDDRLRKDPRHVKVAGLFGADGHRIAGNIEGLPGGLAPNVPTGVVGSTAASVRCRRCGSQCIRCRPANPRDRAQHR